MGPCEMPKVFLTVKQIRKIQYDNVLVIVLKNCDSILTELYPASYDSDIYSNDWKVMTAINF